LLAPRILPRIGTLSIQSDREIWLLDVAATSPASTHGVDGQGAPARTDREEYPSAPLDDVHPQTGTAHPAEEFTHPPGAYLSGEHEGRL